MSNGSKYADRRRTDLPPGIIKQAVNDDRKNDDAVENLCDAEWKRRESAGQLEEAPGAFVDWHGPELTIRSWDQRQRALRFLSVLVNLPGRNLQACKLSGSWCRIEMLPQLHDTREDELPEATLGADGR